MPYYYQADPMNEDNGVIAELPSGNVALIGVATKYHDEDQQSGVNYYTLLHDNLTTEALKTVAAEDYEGNHCQHEYDCCGNTYCNNGRLLWNNDEIAVIEQSWHVNI